MVSPILGKLILKGIVEVLKFFKKGILNFFNLFKKKKTEG